MLVPTSQWHSDVDSLCVILVALEKWSQIHFYYVMFGNAYLRLIDCTSNIHLLFAFTDWEGTFAESLVLKKTEKSVTMFNTETNAYPEIDDNLFTWSGRWYAIQHPNDSTFCFIQLTANSQSMREQSGELILLGAQVDSWMVYSAP